MLGPEGRQRVALGVSRGEPGQSPHSPAPEGRQSLLPDVPLIVCNSVPLQEVDEFLLK